MSSSVPANPLNPVLPDASHASLAWRGLQGNANALALTRAAERHDGPLLILTADESQAWRLEAALRFFASADLPVLHFPDLETLPYDLFSPHQDILSERLATLYRLPQMRKGLIVVSADTLLQRLPPHDYLDARVFLLKVGDRLDMQALRTRLALVGYQGVSEVQAHGEFAVRGAILDIYPMGSREAYRIDLFDDEVESIRSFDPETQRSIGRLDEIRVLPGREFPLDDEAIQFFRRRYRERFPGDPSRSRIYTDVSNGLAPAGIEYYLPLFFEHSSSLFDYLPVSTLLACVGDVEAALQHDWLQIQERFEQRRGDLERPLLPPDEAFVPCPELLAALQSRPGLWLDPPAGKSLAAVEFTAAETPLLAVQTDPAKVAAGLREFLQLQGGRVLLSTESAGRREAVLELLAPAELNPVQVQGWQDFLNGDAPLAICEAALDQGLVLDNPRLALITEAQLLGTRPLAQRARKAVRDPETILRDLTDLSMGSPVVHQAHGVGRYQGLQYLETGGIATEFLVIEYAGGDKLYVPVSSLQLVHRYSGSEPELAPLHRLGNERWQKAKDRAAERVRDVAAELLEIQARRGAQRRTACRFDEADYRRFCTGFPFTETPDQLKAIDAVITDLQSERPMDRVICGDVGFGKTEVALRAAFIAAQNNRQVCVLVPTTLLAQQHYRNFADRFANWPLKVAVLSRLRTSKEQSQLLIDLAQGKIDIVIGTHRLLQDDIKFKNLGLVIVDEEHRFGVRHKEQLKKLRAEVDLLTLTATPIPRTLNMSLAGLRDLSIIATPPTHRLSVKTFIGEWDPATIHEACLREIKRGGQVYFLHNQVEDIDKIGRELQAIVPEATVRIAHGQMRERELEQVMLDFYHRRFNVLLCTTIIESGIDVPTANTIIMNRADRLGLAQLHQLRGRVGRSHHRAYAYLIVPHEKALTGDAEKRLEAIAAMEELGAGFMLATHDLEIRGAGELLGEDQSGQIEEVGFELYTRLLERAVRTIKSGKLPGGSLEPQLDAEIDLGVSTLLPDSYLPDIHGRLILYKRISSARNDEQLRELKVELIDRFGLLPEPSENLFRAASLRLKATALGIRKLEASAQGGQILFGPEPNVDPVTIIKLVQQHKEVYKLDGPSRLRFRLGLAETEPRYRMVESLLERLSGSLSQAS
jgi:transcription-repair coupling factor (superfamily II helicase)